MKEIDKLLSFDLRGRFGHFKKFYSNVSSLSYEIPPRTVIAGMVASVLEIPRDDYYETLNPSKSKFSVSLRKPVRKWMACTNYKKKDGGTTQTRLELLLPENNHLEYTFYCWIEDKNLFSKLANRIQNRQLGYGLYFGQRPFRVDVISSQLFDGDEIIHKQRHKGALNTVVPEKNIISNKIDVDMNIMSSRMPISFKKIEDGREPEATGSFLYELDGNPITGTFKNIYGVNSQYLSFFT